MTHCMQRSEKLAILALCLAMPGMTLGAQQSQLTDSSNTRERAVSEIPTAADAPRVADSLLTALHNRSLLTRAALLQKVDTSPAFDEAAAVAVLQDALHDQDASVRDAALRALLRRDNEAAPTLSESDVAGFQGQDADLARVHLAAKHEDTRTLRDLMLSGDAVVQESAFEAFASRDTASAVAALRSQFRDRDSLTRLQSLQLFTRSVYTSAPDELLPILQEASSDDDPLVSDFAIRTLHDMKVPGSPAP